VVETSQADNFTVRRTFTLEMGNGDFGAFSVAKEAAVTGLCPPSPLPNTTLLFDDRGTCV